MDFIKLSLFLQLLFNADSGLVFKFGLFGHLFHFDIIRMVRLDNWEFIAFRLDSDGSVSVVLSSSFEVNLAYYIRRVGWRQVNTSQIVDFDAGFINEHILIFFFVLN